MAESAKAHDFSFTAIDGAPMPLAQFKGGPVLVVNTASQCGFTPQYRELQSLWEKYRGSGLTVIGVPSNDFGHQEPGSNEEIKQFCEKQIPRRFSTRRERESQRRRRPSVLSMGGERSRRRRGAELEFPQISDRPLRRTRRRLPVAGQAAGQIHHRRHRAPARDLEAVTYPGKKMIVTPAKAGADACRVAGSAVITRRASARHKFVRLA